jgi:GNAT superfamily N-acetyltransferase
MPALDVSLLQPASAETIKQSYLPQLKDNWERAKLNCVANSGFFDFYVCPNKSSFVIGYDRITYAYRVFAETLVDFLEGMGYVKVSPNLTPKDKFLIDDIKTELLPAMKGVLEGLGLQWKAGDTYACWVCQEDKFEQMEGLQQYFTDLAQGIKPASPSLATTLWQQFNKKYSGYSLEYFKHILERYPCGVYYDEKTGEPVGFASCHSDGQGFVQIKEGYRGKGLGAKLLSYYILENRRTGKWPLFAYCLKDNAQIQHILARTTFMEQKGDVNFLFASPKAPRAKL